MGAGAITVNDEGQPTRAITLIDHGRLAGLLHDRVTAAVQGVRPTGNGRRASYRHLSEPRMRNLVVCAGSHDPETLLSGIRRGLYVERADGRNDLATGRFSLVVSEGRGIVNGRLGPPVRPTVVRGELRAALAAITGVGRDVEVSPEAVACTKRGTVDTGLATPTVRVEHLDVLA